MRFSWSRISKFRQCPKAYYYRYVEKLDAPKNENLILGGLIHRMIDAYYTGESIDDIQDEYEGYIRNEQVTTSITLLKHVLAQYVKYYADDIAKEKVIATEQETIVDWTDDDEFIIIVDKIVDREGLVIERDHKSTLKNLKYETDHVRYNGQLLGYAFVTERSSNIKIDAIEIDEIRLAELEQPPFNKDGTPTIDIRKLSNVTFEAYYNVLEAMGIHNDERYQTALTYLEKRGHPLFRRVLVQYDEVFAQVNAIDMNETIELIKQERYPRTVGRLCDWCEYRDLCRLDFADPTESDREIMIRGMKLEVRPEDE